ncbi:PDR/VanB family oxidoreductase [Actinoplanes sp. NPDC051411]|uniref:PDR/VanB family oxidoreductase n=1 Tax=Actinoplanes sp. NPDC051411 TaxID=3155522 RepID=UPI0034367406
MDLVVHSRTPLAAGVVGLRLVHPAGEPLPQWEPGAHIDLHLATGLTRSYSLCGNPADLCGWEIAVLRTPSGRGGSTYIHDRLVIGDKIRVTGPRNHFPLVSADRYRFIAGGIGITPLLPMLAAAPAPWHLTYGGRSRESMAFLDRLPAAADIRVGPIDLDLALGPPSPGTAIYCCGPASLLDAVAARCDDSTLHVERFAAGPSAGQNTEFEVELAYDGRTLTIPADQSILSVLEEAGVPVMSSCREGTCGTCETEVLGGVPDHRDALLTPAERAAGEVMFICVSRTYTPSLRLAL